MAVAPHQAATVSLGGSELAEGLAPRPAPPGIFWVRLRVRLRVRDMGPLGSSEALELGSVEALELSASDELARRDCCRSLRRRAASFRLALILIRRLCCFW